MLKVMLVDDDRNVIQCLNSLIDWEALGCEVAGEAYNGEDAYRIAMETCPDVIISDVKMPVMGGAELVQKIRETLCDVEIILLSGYEDFAVAQLALKYQVKEYILKPITRKKIDALADTLRKLQCEHQNKAFLDNILNNGDVKREIREMLSSGNGAYFTKLFQEFLRCEDSNFTMIRDICMQMARLLCEYYTELGTAYVGKDILRELSDLKKKLNVIAYTADLYFDALLFKSEDKSEYYRVLISNVKQYIQEHYSDQMLNIAGIADRFNFSPDYISRLFSQYAGTTINAFITRLRQDKAMTLLSDPEIPIQSISDLVGYTSSNYFSKVFKKHIGFSPSDYRERVYSVAERLSDD